MESSISSGGGPDHASADHQKEEEDRFLKKLKSLDYWPYVCQKDMVRYPGLPYETVFAGYMEEFQIYGLACKPIIEDAMDLGTVKHYSYSDLQRFTHSFSNILCKTLHGRLFEGKIKGDSAHQDVDVIVKTWDFFFPPSSDYTHHLTRIHDELIFLRDPEIRSHRNVVKLIGYHCDRKLAVIYEETRPKHFLKQILKDDTFKWEDRMKVAIEIGKMLKMFHDKGFVHGGVNAAFMTMDESFCAKTFDFGLRTSNQLCYRELFEKHLKAPAWSSKDDVFEYGILLLELISKNDFPGVYPLYEQFRGAPFQHDAPVSAVHQSFAIGSETAYEITYLASSCLQAKSNDQPPIGTIVDNLEKLVHPRATKKPKLS